MNYNIFFSPTGSTQKVTTFVSYKIGEYQDIDLSVFQKDYTMQLEKDDMCVIGVPSFGGRVPHLATERLEMIKGHQTPSIIIVTYGNRAYEDTLLELKTILTKNGFQCFGAMAIVCEHSIMHEFAKGRPTQQDYAQMEQFVETIKKRMKVPLIDVKVPGNRPYKPYGVIPLKPFATKKCTECGLCGKLCPIGAISLDHPSQTNNDICISCMRCVEICPRHARQCPPEMIDATIQKLRKVCEVEKQNDFF